MGLSGQRGVVQQESEAAVLSAGARGVERVRGRCLLGVRVALLQHPPAGDLQSASGRSALPSYQRRHPPQRIAGAFPLPSGSQRSFGRFGILKESFKPPIYRL